MTFLPSPPRLLPGGLLALIGLLATASPLRTAVAGEASSQAGDPVHHVAQARLFLKRGWTDDAAAELALARSTPAGQALFEVWWLSSQVAWSRLDALGARNMATHALSRADSEAQRAEVSAWITNFDQNFGRLQLSAPQDGLSSRLQLESTGLIFDTEHKKYLDKLALTWREKTELPLEIALPAGSYLINGQSLEIKAGSAHEMQLPMKALGSKGLAALQVTRMEAAFGVLVMGGDLATLRPAPQAQLGLTLPAGPLLLGLMGDYAIQKADIGTGEDLRAPGGFSGGIRIGGEVFTSLPLSIRPSAVLRYGQLPAVPVACDPGAGPWACQVGNTSAGQAAGLVSGQAWMPGGELVVEYREAGRTTAFGAGIKLEVDAILGKLPSEGESVAKPEGESWTLADPAVRGTASRILANISLAF